MNSKTTGIWFVIAAALFAFCFFFARRLHPPSPAVPYLFPHFQAAQVSAVQVDPAHALEIRAARAGRGWQLNKPVTYPAQRGAINNLLDALQNLKIILQISAAESKENKANDVDYGFDKPPFQLILSSGDQRTQLVVGNHTALGDQVYLRIIGREGTFVVDASWLNLLPTDADSWRDTALVDADQSFDWIMLTNANRTIELRRDPATQLWRMLLPLPSRANSQFIDQALQRLQASQISSFVTNAGDLAGYGLQPAGLDLWLGNASNLTSSVHVGRTVTNGVGGDYVLRDNWNVVALAPREAFSAWRSQVNDFRDPYLFELTQPVVEIDTKGLETYALKRETSNTWSVVGQKYSGDPEVIQAYVKILASLKVTDFVKDVATPVDFQNCGFSTNSLHITVRCAADGTNTTSTEILFGSLDTNNNTVYVRRADERSIYAMSQTDVMNLPDYAWQFRDRQIWNFTGEEVAQVTIHQDGKVRQLIHHGLNKWELGPNSQGMIVGKLIEESIGGMSNVKGLCELSAAQWESPNVTNSQQFGFTTNSLEITLELKNGEKHTIKFGQELKANSTALAMVNLDGQDWMFVCPPILYQFVSTYLTIPADIP